MSVLISELKDLRAQAVQGMDDLVTQADKDTRDLTEEEAGRFKGLEAEKDRLKGEIERRESLEKAKAELDQSQRKTEPPNATVEPIRQHANISVVHSSRKLRAFESYDAAYGAGRWLMATIAGHDKSRQWCLDQGIEFRQGFEGRALSTNVNPLGGFLVPDEMERAIIKNRNDFGVVRQNADIKTMQSDHQSFPKWSDSPDVIFPGEGGTITPGDNTYASVTVTAKKAASLQYISSELMEDAIIDIADDLAADMGRKFAEKEDECGLTADGTAAFGGMVGIAVHIIDGTHEAGSVELAAGHDLFSEVDLADALSVIGAVQEYAIKGGNAKIYCSQVCKSMVFDRLKGAAGGQTIIDGQIVSNEFAGYPIVVTSLLASAPLTDYTDLVMWLFGDMRKSTLFGDRRGITIKVDGSARLLQDQIAVLGTERFDINTYELGDNTTTGAMVAGVGGT